MVGNVPCYIHTGYLGLYFVFCYYVSCLIKIELALKEIGIWLVAYCNENPVEIKLLLLVCVNVLYFDPRDFGIAKDFFYDAVPYYFYFRVALDPFLHYLACPKGVPPVYYRYAVDKLCKE